MFSLQGGIAYITIKGAMRIYFKQQQYLRQAQRTILDYEEPEVPVVPNPPPPQPADQPAEQQPAEQ